MALHTKFLICLSILIQPALAQMNPDTMLHQLSRQHQFVKMDSLNNALRGKDYYFYKGLFANVCNHPRLSIAYLDSLHDLAITTTYEYYKLKNDNDIKVFNYKGAYETSKILTTEFKARMSAGDLDDEINTQRIWEVMQAQPAQTISSFNTFGVPIKKDKAGLITTNVHTAGADTNFVFDTGAGISCITHSMAKQMGMIFLPDNQIEVSSFTGVKNHVIMGLMPEMKLGEAVIRNAAFLVYPDSAFTFAKGAYVINGIVGFPIIKELGTITFEHDSLTFSRSGRESFHEKNLFVDQLRAIVMVHYRNKTLPFNFDSGADVSFFNQSFYEAFKTYIDQHSVRSMVKRAGAGGVPVTSAVLKLQDQVIGIGDSRILLRSMTVDKDDYGVYGKVNYGNIGQDVIGQFKKVILSLDYNYLELVN